MNGAHSLQALTLIRKGGQITRLDLAGQMGISLSLAGKVVSELLAKGLVSEEGHSSVSGGRPANLLALDPSAGYAVGLDIGGESQSAVVVDLRGDVVASLSEPTVVTTDRELILQNLKNLVQQVVQRAPIPAAAVLGVGLGLRDIVDPVAGVTYGWPDTPGWSQAWMDFPIREALAAMLPYAHTRVEDAVRCLGLAEARYGVGCNEGDFIYLLIDTGIGLTILIDGKPYIGPSHISGEIGHIPLGAESYPCGCGNMGCVETLASTTAILWRLHQRLDESGMRSRLRGLEREAGIQDVLAAAQEGDKLAYQILTEAGEYLGSALAIVLNLFGPQLVVLGGSAVVSDLYLEAAERVMKLRALEMTSRRVRLVRSNLGDLAGARGAATLVLDACFDPGDKNILNLLHIR